MPYSLFHQFASPAIVPRPDNAVEWVAHGEGWEPMAKAPAIPLSLFKRRVETSPELAHLLELAERFGPEGQAVILRAFENGLKTRNESIGTARLQDNS